MAFENQTADSAENYDTIPYNENVPYFIVTIIAALGVSLNIAILCSILFREQARKQHNIFIANMATADAVTGSCLLLTVTQTLVSNILPTASERVLCGVSLA